MRGFFDEGELVGVLTTQPLDRPLDYVAPEGGCALGAFVEVPLGPRQVPGVVWGPGEGTFERSKIRPVIRVLDAAPMREEMQGFVTRAAEYTLTPLPQMLRLIHALLLASAEHLRKIYGCCHAGNHGATTCSDDYMASNEAGPPTAQIGRRR